MIEIKPGDIQWTDYSQEFVDEWKSARRFRAQAVSSTVVSKCGVHSIGPKRTGYGDMLAAVNAAGRRLSVVKCRDDFGAAFEAKEYWDDCLTIGAMTEYDGGPFGEAEWNAFIRRANLNPWVDAWEIRNEQNGAWAEQAALYMWLMPRFTANNLTLVMFNCASGTPDYNDTAAYYEIARACRYAKDNGHSVMLGLHAYGYGPETLDRWRHLADYLESVGALIPIVRTEYGPEEGGPQIPTDQLIAWIAEHDPIGDSRIVGDALWTTGGGWADISPSFGAIGQYIANAVPVDPPPPSDEWIVDDVLIDGVSIGPQMSGEIVMTADHTLELKQHPKPITHNLTVVETPSGGWRFEPRSGPHNHGEIVEWQIVKA